MFVVLAPGDGIIPLGESPAHCESGGRRAEARRPKGLTSTSGRRYCHFVLPIVYTESCVPPSRRQRIELTEGHVERSCSRDPLTVAVCKWKSFFPPHPEGKRFPAEDTAGSVREVLARGDKSSAAIAGRRAADHYKGVILAESVQDNAENFTRFVLLLPESQAAAWLSPDARKVSLAMRLAHRPGALLASLAPFAKHAVNLLKIESRPIHGRPCE